MSCTPTMPRSWSRVPRSRAATERGWRPGGGALARLGVSVLLAALISGCSPESFLRSIVSPADRADAEHIIDLLRQGRFEEIEEAADPELRNAALPGELRRMAALVPPGEPTSVELVGAHRWTTPDGVTVSTTFEYLIRQQWLLVNVTIRRHKAARTIVTLGVAPQPASLAEQHRFTLSRKSRGHYLLLAGVIVVPLLTLCALVVCVRTKMKGRKRRWIVFILFGVGSLAMNWTTGQWTVAPLTVQLFGASAFAPVHGPWTLAVSLPVGAIVFLLMRNRLAESTDSS